MYDTVEEAMTGLQEAEMDVAADMGEEAVEAGWSDLVHSIAGCCSEPVKSQFLQRNGFGG